jgi:hypothetical protein
MNLPRLLIVPLLAFAFFLTLASFSLPTAVTAQKEKSAHSKKQVQYHYVCPMHENVTSKSRGKCRKCKMKLVRKPIVKEEPTTGSN